jgi:hypothetical protein
LPFALYVRNGNCRPKLVKLAGMGITVMMPDED